MTEEHQLDIVADPLDASRALLSARRSKNLTQEVLAERVGVAQPTIARYEGGSRAWSVEHLFAAAHALGLDVAFVPRVNVCPTCGTETHA